MSLLRGGRCHEEKLPFPGMAPSPEPPGTPTTYRPLPNLAHSLLKCCRLLSCRFLVLLWILFCVLSRHTSMPNPVVFFDVAANGEPVGRIEMVVSFQCG